MPNYLGDKALSNLNTKFYYTSLNKGNDDCQDEAFYNIAKKKLEDYDWVEDVSKHILKGLCKVYRKSLNDNFDSDICKFLYFWLGNILLDKLEKKFLFFDVIHDLFNNLTNNKIGKICKLPHHYMEVDNFKNIKLFFDYSVDYNNYIQQLAGNIHSCNNAYKTYLDSYVSSYKNIKVKCAENPNRNTYCNEFHEYFNGKDAYYLSNWTCDLQENGKEDQELEDDEEVAKESGLSPGTVMVVQPAAIQNEVSSVRGQEGHGPGSSVYHTREGISDLSNISNLPEDSSPSTIKKSITSAVSAAGVLVPPFLIYNVISIVIVQQDFLFYI
ncbi:hypothetical protein PVIIG_06337 [Plasmodium vivax India VII]|uniref:Uncharacterized protein n=1 Tax=Plasmodium vivax India VII TaxID=1077284 RepID=A0A0J9S270_PLAVI|nr:hypothetical protein PVIIG_06337 [Plasmodium vivax India VII]